MLSNHEKPSGAEKSKRMVWYCSYGSNMREQRFFAYVRGGTVPGLQALDTCSDPGRPGGHDGCADKTIPSRSLPVAFPLPLIFSGSSLFWKAAPAHLDITGLTLGETKVHQNRLLIGNCMGKTWASREALNEMGDSMALGRTYLITEDQLFDIIQQENHMSSLPFERDLSKMLSDDGLAEKGYLQLPLGGASYDHLLFFGYHDGVALVSFSGNRGPETVAAPNAAYLNTIIEGLRETFHYGVDEIVNYLKRKPGIVNLLAEKELQAIAATCLHSIETRNRESLVWYSSYGSNMWRERFMCYIAGGSPKGSTSVQRGAVDSTEPRSTRPICYKKEIFFGRKHPFWNAATCYLNVYDESVKDDRVINSDECLIVGNDLGGDCWSPEAERAINARKEAGETVGLGRMYLITAEQFLEVLRQENHEQCMDVDLQAATSRLVTTVDADSYYGDLVYLGIVEGFPVFSFSGENDVREQGQKPSIPYIRTIVKGLRDTFSMTDSETIDYLLHLRGIEGNYSADDLAEAMS